jgi:transcription elongation factor GreA
MKKYFTKEGIEKLKEELSYLEKEKRKEVADQLKFAASFGDLSENSAYDDAKNEQNILETKISKLRETIKEASIYESTDNKDVVQIGMRIEIETKGMKSIIEIVGGTDTDPFSGKISSESPMGKAFLGKKKGEVCIVQTPSGEKKFKILKII